MNLSRFFALCILVALSLSAHAAGRLADIAIYDRALGRELPVHWHDGRPYVVGQPGSEYQIVVRNRVGEDLLAVVAVDGVNVVTGETANPQQGGYIISPWQQLDIRGWRKSLGEIASFYFTSLADSYAARTGRPDDVGVIGVALYRRKYDYLPYSNIGPEEPYDAKSAKGKAQAARPKNGYAQPAAPLGTGHGRREYSQAQWGEFERSTSEPVEVVAIYYDSYPNLVAQGVLYSPNAPRDPYPFPSAFVPDPLGRGW
ncbi:MAG TPA: hypothetical protein VN878_00695 [Usitatibacter sp.]|nr:hypothetical protein [Usitatibacter sp.]